MIDPLYLSKCLIACNDLLSSSENALNLLAKTLEDNGFFCEKIYFDENGYNKTANLFAYIDIGDKNIKNNIAFAGHTDVVGVGNVDEWITDPFIPTTLNNLLYGRGVVDMKVALACFVAAGINIAIEKNKKHNGRISFIITNNEESDSNNGTPKLMQWILKNNMIPSCCIVGEPTSSEDFGDTIKIGRRGSVNFILKIFGKSGHVAYPHLVINPILNAIKVLSILDCFELDKGDQYFDSSFLNITSVTTDTDLENVIPYCIIIKFNIRYNTLFNVDNFLEILNKDLIDINVNYEINYKITAEPFISKESKILNIAKDSIKNIIGIIPSLSTSGGTSDARYISKYCDTIEFGLLSSTAHQANERTEIDSIEKLYLIYRDIINKFLLNQ